MAIGEAAGHEQEDSFGRRDAEASAGRAEPVELLGAGHDARSVVRARHRYAALDVGPGEIGLEADNPSRVDLPVVADLAAADEALSLD